MFCALCVHSVFIVCFTIGILPSIKFSSMALVASYNIIVVWLCMQLPHGRGRASVTSPTLFCVHKWGVALNHTHLNNGYLQLWLSSFVDAVHRLSCSRCASEYLRINLYRY